MFDVSDFQGRLRIALGVHCFGGWRRNRQMFGKPDFVFPQR